MKISAAMAPVVGELEPHMGGPFGSFDTGFIHGLARAFGYRLDLLAFNAYTPGQGDFREFLLACQRAYKTIVVWQILNPDVPAMLARHGFHDAVDQIGGELPESVMRWDAHLRANKEKSDG